MQARDFFRRYWKELLCAGVLAAAIIIFVRPTKGGVLDIQKDQPFQNACAHAATDSAGLSRFDCTLIRLMTRGHIVAAEYKVPRVVVLPVFAWRLEHGKTGIEQVKITFPEGSTYDDMITIINATFPNIQTGAVQEAYDFTQNHRVGYYFPDTYFFPKTATLADILMRMEEEAISTKLAIIRDPANANNEILKKYSWDDVVIMASILEKEAKPDDARMIAGILWKRLSAGWPLQVDATFQVYLGKESSQLTEKDLQTDSPWNTYTHKGLPPAPIDNPGKAMLEAALEPTDSPYWYYLHDATGVVHYAKTLDEQQSNTKKYLR